MCCGQSESCRLYLMARVLIKFDVPGLVGTVELHDLAPYVHITLVVS